MPRLFTPAQANRTLPLVRRIVTDILAKGGELRALVASHPQGLPVKQHERAGRLDGELRELFRELERVGCSFRDAGFQRGLVDFPARIDGEDVLLCWQTEEPRVAWFHAPDAGFAGRRPIPAALLGQDEPETA